MKTFIISVLTLVVILGVGYLLFTKGNTTVEQKIAQQPGDFSHVPNDEELRAGLTRAGLDALAAEGTVMHIHQHLDITVNGEKIIIPADVGEGTTYISPLHTHDTQGILHVESPVQKDFTLGQFFTEWGVRLDDNCVSSFCSDDSHKLVVGVNGKPITNPQAYVLKPRDEIHIWYGAKDENPNLVQSYDFAPGL